MGRGLAEPPATTVRPPIQYGKIPSGASGTEPAPGARDGLDLPADAVCLARESDLTISTAGTGQCGFRPLIPGGPRPRATDFDPPTSDNGGTHRSRPRRCAPQPLRASSASSGAAAWRPSTSRTTSSTTARSRSRSSSRSSPRSLGRRALPSRDPGSPPGCSTRTSCRCSTRARPPGASGYTMPYVEGETLRDRLARASGSSRSRTRSGSRGGGRALDYAHRHGRHPPRHQAGEHPAHRTASALVADFGIAQGAERRAASG